MNTARAGAALPAPCPGPAPANVTDIGMLPELHRTRRDPPDGSMEWPVLLPRRPPCPRTPTPSPLALPRPRALSRYSPNHPPSRPRTARSPPAARLHSNAPRRPTLLQPGRWPPPPTPPDAKPNERTRPWTEPQQAHLGPANQMPRRRGCIDAAASLPFRSATGMTRGVGDATEPGERLRRQKPQPHRTHRNTSQPAPRTASTWTPANQAKTHQGRPGVSPAARDAGMSTLAARVAAQRESAR